MSGWLDSGGGDGYDMLTPEQQATVDDAPLYDQCPVTTPEPHRRGEFPMTCYPCHVEADS